MKGFGLFWAGLGLLAAASGCGSVTIPAPAPTPTPTPTPSWSAAHSLDLGKLSPDFNGGSGFVWEQTFRRFQVHFNSSEAVLTAPLYDGATFRATARVYHPYSSGGTGWVTTLGSDFAYLDDGTINSADVPSAIDPSGDILAAFWYPSLTGEAESELYSGGTWGSQQNSIFGSANEGTSSYPRSAANSNGWEDAAVWDSQQRAYLSWVDSSHKLEISRYASQSWGGPLATFNVDPVQVEALNDGFGITFIWSDGIYGLYTAWSLNSNFAQATLATKGKAFASATDGNGDVFVVYHAPDATVSSSSCAAAAVNCDTRVFAAVRGASGTWSSSRLDQLDSLNSTFYQDASHGLWYATPGAAYLGNGQFLAVFAGIDASDSSHPVSGIYSRVYTVGSGWDTSTHVIESESISGTSLYRVASDLRLVTDGNGNAMLIVTHMLPGHTADPATENLGIEVYRFSSGTWSGPAELSGFPEYPISIWSSLSAWGYAANLRTAGAIFGNEAAVVFAAPLDTGTDVKLGLFGSEFH